MRVQLRQAVADGAAFYRERYPDGYDHRTWTDHVERVRATVDFAEAALEPEGYRLQAPVVDVADLSCGDGVLATTLARRLHCPAPPFLGDVNGSSAGGDLDVIGALPGTLHWLPQGLCLYVCSETLEHLDDPDGFLTALRLKTRYLLLTTPEGETGDGNPEHYWGWDSEAVGAMLAAAGFTAVLAHRVFTPVYTTPDVIPTQMWMCS